MYHTVFSVTGKIFIRDFVEELKMHDIEIDDEELGKGSSLLFFLNIVSSEISGWSKMASVDRFHCGVNFIGTKRRVEGQCAGSLFLLVLLGRGWNGRSNSSGGGRYRIKGGGRALLPSTS